MPVQSLNIDLSNAALNTFLFECLYEETRTYQLRIAGMGGGGGVEGRTGRQNQLGTLITPAVLYGYTWSWTPIHQVMGSYIKLCWTIALRTSSRVQFSFI